MWHSCFLWARTHVVSLVLPLCLLVVGAGTLVAFTPNVAPESDASQYEALARSILEGGYSLDGVHPSMFREPGYPFAKALFYALGGTTRGFLWVQVCLVAVTALLWWAACRELRTNAAWIGPWGVVGAYGYWRFVVSGQYEVILGCWLAFAFYALIRFWKEQSYGWLAGSGFSFGMLMLTRSVYQFLWIPAFWAGWYFLRQANLTRKTVAQWFAVFTLFVLVLPAGWSLRNRATFGTYKLADRAGLVLLCRAVLTSAPWSHYIASAGSVLLGEQVVRSWFPDAQPLINTHWKVAGDRMSAAIKAADGDIHQADSVLLAEAKQEITATPGSFAKFLAWTPIELVRLFGLPSFEYPHSTMESMFRGVALPLSRSKTAVVLLVHGTQLVYFGFILVGGWLLLKSRSALVLLATPIGYLAIIHAPLDNVVRFSAPVQPLLWMLVLFSISHLLSRSSLWRQISKMRFL